MAAILISQPIQVKSSQNCQETFLGWRSDFEKMLAILEPWQPSWIFKVTFFSKFKSDLQETFRKPSLGWIGYFEKMLAILEQWRPSFGFLKKISISQPFLELWGWNFELKLITLISIGGHFGSHLGTMVGTLDFSKFRIRWLKTTSQWLKATSPLQELEGGAHRAPIF